MFSMPRHQQHPGPIFTPVAWWIERCNTHDVMHPQGTREFDEQGQLQQTRVTVNVAASTDARMPSEHGQSATRLWSPSSQHNLTSSTLCAVTGMLSYVPTSSRVFTPVSVPLNELQAASSSNMPLGTSPSSPLLNHRWDLTSNKIEP
jgi:hypothetical protein